MAVYVDGFVVPLARKNIAAYKKIARLAGKIWREHGALEYHECVGEDLKVAMGTGFPEGLKLKRGETVVFAWITYKSRTHRDKVNAKVMADPRIAEMMPEKNMPFDPKRILWGGFETLVSFK